MSRHLPSEVRQRQIVDAAVKIIALQGLGRFTTASIAADVGVSDGAIFRHFPTKDAIVLAVMDRVEEAMFEGFPPVDGDPIARVREFFLQRVRLMLREPLIATLVFSDQLKFATGEAGVEKVAMWKARSLVFLFQTLDEARTQGLLRTDLDIDDVVLLIQGSLAALLLMRDALDPEALADRAGRAWTTLERLVRS